MTTITITDISAISPDHPDGILRILESAKPKNDAALKSIIKVFRDVHDPYSTKRSAVDADAKFVARTKGTDEEIEQDKQKKDHEKSCAVDNLNTATWGNGMSIEFEPLDAKLYTFASARDAAILRCHGIIA